MKVIVSLYHYIIGTEKLIKSKDTEIAILKEMVKSSEYQRKAK